MKVVREENFYPEKTEISSWKFSVVLEMKFPLENVSGRLSELKNIGNFPPDQQCLYLDSERAASPKAV